MAGRTLLLAALLASPAIAGHSSRAAGIAAKVTVHADSPLATVPACGYGLNTAAWDGSLLDAEIPGLLRTAGVATLRYPGGSFADVYHWQTHTAGQGQTVHPAANFDAFMGVAAQCGAQAVVTVNYGTNALDTAGGDPAEAAAWVEYANHTKRYGVRYWEIGNEVYGNGRYETKWEADLHADHSPEAYGRNVALYAAAMKAKDPTIRIGAVLTAPGQWPDELTPHWNDGVLAECGGVIDFVSVHWYPLISGEESDAVLLAAPAVQIPVMMSRLRDLIRRYGGPDAGRIQVFVTETNSVPIRPGKQSVSLVNAMYLADNLATWLENGAANAQWWDLHNGAESNGNLSASLYGPADFGDYGILASGRLPGPPRNTSYPPYHGLQMLARLVQPGDILLHAVSDQRRLAVHAARRADGSLAVLLINQDAANHCAADISVCGFTPAGQSTDHSYGMFNETTGISTAPGVAAGHFTRSLPPYSMTTVVLQPSRD